MAGLFKDLADKAAAGKLARAELRQLRALKKRLLALDGDGTCPCCPRMKGKQHYSDCALFKERAVEFVINETENIRGVTRWGR